VTLHQRFQRVLDLHNSEPSHQMGTQSQGATNKRARIAARLTKAWPVHAKLVSESQAVHTVVQGDGAHRAKRRMAER
jgi:hypothetical protein